MRTQKSSITKNTCWPQIVLTLPMFADPTVLPFPECHINGSLQHVAFLNWLSFSIGVAARMVVVSRRAVFQVRVATVGPVIHLMDDVRIVFLKTIFLIFLKSPHAATKTRCRQIKKKKKKKPLSFDSNLKKNPGGKGTPRSGTILEWKKQKKYILNFHTLSCCRFINAKAYIASLIKQNHFSLLRRVCHWLPKESQPSSHLSNKGVEREAAIPCCATCSLYSFWSTGTDQPQ